MPLLRIRHTTNYTYSAPVLLDPHSVRLVPRNGAAVKVLRHTLDVSPTPAGRSTGLDAEGNPFHYLWFSGYSNRLTLTTTSDIETIHHNPLNFVLTAGAAIPFTYRPADRPALEASLARAERSPAVDALVAELLRNVGGDTVAFLLALCTRINEKCTRVHRSTGAPYPPAQTLAQAEGSCRDLAVLFQDACRSAGLAARFISGYILEGSADDRRELHAWAEVYLPGPGWRAFDPSRGLAVAYGYIPLAAAANPASAAPITGAFRAANATAALSARIEIESLDTATASR